MSPAIGLYTIVALMGSLTMGTQLGRHSNELTEIGHLEIGQEGHLMEVEVVLPIEHSLRNHL